MEKYKISNHLIFALVMQDKKICKRFLERVASLTDMVQGSGVTPKLETAFHKTVKKVTEDIEDMKFNTAIASLMTLVNEFYEHKPTRGDIKALLTLVSPFAPHIADELWEIQGFDGYASTAKWPKYDEKKLVESEKTIAVQVNGKLKTTVTIPTDADDDTVFSIASSDDKIKGLMNGMEVVRKIVVKNKLINIILRPAK